MRTCKNEVVLASASPRRKELLKLIVPEFTVCASSADETIDISLCPCEQVTLLARAKAFDVKKLHVNSVIIAADTLVYLDEPFGKPKNAQDAFRMLKKLSGRKHKVYTGVCVLYKDKILSDYECTEVEFDNMSDEEIRSYIATGEPLDSTNCCINDLVEMIKAGWMYESGKWKTYNGNRPVCIDKAGAYEIQGYASKFIKRINGCYFNVMGLPVHKLYQMLKDLKCFEFENIKQI